MLAVLVEQQHGEEAGPGPTARCDVKRRRRLRDLLAVPAGGLLTHGLDHLPRARNHFQRLGHILAEPGQTVAAAGWAPPGRGADDTVARAVIGERPTAGLLAPGGADGGCLGSGNLEGGVVL